MKDGITHSGDFLGAAAGQPRVFLHPFPIGFGCGKPFGVSLLESFEAMVSRDRHASGSDRRAVASHAAVPHRLRVHVVFPLLNSLAAADTVGVPGLPVLVVAFVEAGFQIVGFVNPVLHLRFGLGRSSNSGDSAFICNVRLWLTRLRFRFFNRS